MKPKKQYPEDLERNAETTWLSNKLFYRGYLPDKVDYWTFLDVPERWLLH